MKYWFDSIRLDTVGEVTVLSEGSDNGGLTLPHHEVRSISLQIEVFEQSYEANRGLINQVRSALDSGYGVLKMQEEDVDEETPGTIHLNRPVTVKSHSLPEDPNSWGTYNQLITIEFDYVVNLDTSGTHLPMTFQKTGSGVQLTLGHVTSWRTAWQVSRFHPMRSLREMVTEQVAASGEFQADPTTSLATQRGALALLMTQWRDSLNGADGTMIYGSFLNRVVRVQSFEAEVDQAVNMIRWSMTFSYTIHPDESDYASVDYNVDKDEDFAESSNAILQINGKVAAQSYAAAITKLNSLRSTVLAAYGFTSSVLDRRGAQERSIDCDDGTAFVELSFSESFRMLSDSAGRMPISFVKTGGGASIDLGHVEKWSQGYRAQRYLEVKNIRERASGGVSVSGEYVANMSQPVETRRAALQAKVASWEAEVNNKDGQLKYGPTANRFFDRKVRIDEFRSEIDKAVSRIKWSLSASYTIFPDEENFAGADFRVNRSKDHESGDETLTFSGTIKATSDSIATAKLDTLREAMLTAEGYTTGQKLKSDQDRHEISANDGDGFIELNFSETYRKRASDILNWKLTVNDDDDVTSGLLTRTYSGTVTASGTDADTAYATARAKAEELGDNKHTFRMRARIGRSDRKTSASADREFVTLDFSFEYRLKGSRVYIEVQGEVSEQVYGEKTERVSGFVVAADEATARTNYTNQVRAAYNGTAIRGESTTASRQKIEAGTYTSGTWGGTGTFAELQVRLDFNFEVFKPKANGTWSIKYGYKVAFDYSSNAKMVTIQGRVFGGADILDAVLNQTSGNPLDSLITTLAPGGSRRSSEREVDRENNSAASHDISVSFSETYEAKLTAEAQILECELTEDIQYSGTRWQFKALPDAPSVPQECGTEPGRRTVSGSVTATTEAAAMDWVKKSHALSFYSGIGGGAAPSARYEDPPNIRRKFDFLPLVDGTARGSGVNVRVYIFDFTFTETLLDYPYSEA